MACCLLPTLFRSKQSRYTSCHAATRMLYRERNEFVLSEQVLANTLYKLSDSQGEDAPPTLQAHYN